VLELQGHGGPVVLQLLLARCLAVAQSAKPRANRFCPGCARRARANSPSGRF
jgi:tRNA modification GTPase